MISPLKRLEIIDSLCSQLDLALEETVYAGDGTPTDISASMVVKQMTKELLFFREEIFRQYRAGMNCQNLPKVRSGNPLKAFESAAQTYNSFLLSLFINVAIKHCHINKIFYSRFARPLRGNRKTWQLLLRQVHVFQIGKEIFTCRSNNRNEAIL